MLVLVALLGLLDTCCGGSVPAEKQPFHKRNAQRPAHGSLGSQVLSTSSGPHIPRLVPKPTELNEAHANSV